MAALHIFAEVQRMIAVLPRKDDAKIKDGLRLLGDETPGLLHIKTLRGPIKELIIKQYRLVFFVIYGTIYVVDIFKKQSRKTPLRIIERAEKLYQLVQSRL